MLSVAAFTGGEHVPSARFRIRQYIDILSSLGVSLDELPSKAGQYPPGSQFQRPVWLVQALLEKIFQIPRSRRYELVIIQRELISTILSIEPLLGKMRVLDVDDAIWVHPRGGFAGRLAEKCDAVICGNKYLESYFSKYCQRTFVLPTAVDTDIFRPGNNEASQFPVIGWTGTAGNLIELEAIEEALTIILDRFKNARLRIICNERPRFSLLPNDRVDYICWSPSVEVSALQDLTVGIMPLRDTEWTRGKCAFKMLTYMACGIPVVTSPVGVNSEILAKSIVGFGARATDDWVDALSIILSDRDLAKAMGRAGRELIELEFSTRVLGARFADIIKSIVY